MNYIKKSNPIFLKYLVSFNKLVTNNINNIKIFVIRYLSSHVKFLQFNFFERNNDEIIWTYNERNVLANILSLYPFIRDYITGSNIYIVRLGAIHSDFYNLCPLILC